MITTSLAALPSMSNLESLICVLPGGLLCFCAWPLFDCRVATGARLSVIWYLGSSEKLFWDVPWELRARRCLSLPDFIWHVRDWVRTCSLTESGTIAIFLSGCCFWSFTRDGLSTMVPLAFSIFFTMPILCGDCVWRWLLDGSALSHCFSCLQDSHTLFCKPFPSLRVASRLWWLVSV